MIDFFIRMSILQIAWIGILRIIEMSEEKIIRIMTHHWISYL